MADILLLVFTALLGLIYSFLRSQPDLVSQPVLDYLWLAVVTSGAIILVRITSYLLVDVLLTRFSWAQPSRLLRFLVTVSLYSLAIVLVFKFVLELDVVAIVTASAVMTAIIALAVNNTLGHLFSGIGLNLERPFRIGDYVKIDGQLGEVESSSWRSIFVRTFYGSLLVYPNSKIMNETVEVFPGDEEPGNQITIPAPISVPPQQVARLINDVIGSVPHIRRHRSPIIKIEEFSFDKRETGPWITLYQVIYYPESARLGWYTDALIKERVWYAFSRNGIDGYIGVQDGADLARTHLDLIATNPIFVDIAENEKVRLLKGASSLLYAAGEPILAEGDCSCSMFIVSRGTVNVHAGAPPESGSPAVTDELVKTCNSSPPVWQPRMLERISAEFATYMGPIARYLVDQAASKTSDPYWLYRVLSQEIPDQADRAAFLDGSPPHPVVQLRRGDFFGELSLFTGVPARLPAMEALDEVELLELKPPVLAELLASNTGLTKVFSDRLAEWEGSTSPESLRRNPSEATLDRQALLQQINLFHQVADKTL